MVSLQNKHKVNGQKLLLYIVITVLVAFTAMPIIYLVSTAFKPLDEMFLFPPEFFVRHPTMKNFSDLFFMLNDTAVPFTRYLFNSVFVSLATVFATIVVCSMAAFSLTKLKLPFSNLIYNIIIATLLFSPPVTQITNYILVQKLGMMNTTFALIIPKIAGSLYFFLLKQNFSEVPDALLDAAKIDGCTYWGLYAKIMMPMTKPAWATAVVFSFVASWNDFTSPLFYIQKEALKTLPLALQTLQGGTGQVATTGAFAAAALLTILPTIILFVAMQSLVIKTMAHSGIK